MASSRAVREPHGASDTAYERARKAMFEEGISSARGCTSTRRGPSVEDVLDEIVAGLRQQLHVRRGAHPRGVPRAGDGRHAEHRRVRGGRPLHTSW